MSFKNMKKLVLKTLFEEDKYAQWLKFRRLELGGFSFLEPYKNGEKNGTIKVRFSFINKWQKVSKITLNVNYRLAITIFELGETLDLEHKAVTINCLNYEVAEIKFQLTYNQGQGISTENVLFKKYLDRLLNYRTEDNKKIHYDSVNDIYKEYVLKEPIFNLLFNNEEDRATIKSKILATIEKDIKNKQSDKAIVENKF